jgi:AcrR family transcriptional regulator
LTHDDGIGGNKRAHEDDYFRKKDRELLESLRKADQQARQRQALEQQTGIHDPETLRELSDLGFTLETIALLPLVPVLQVAWAESGISAAERRLIVDLARSRGIAAGSPADQQLSEWLDAKPSEATFQKATRLIAAMVDAPDHGIDFSPDQLIEQCDRIAHASGGIFGIGAVSAEERAVLQQVAAALKAR